MNFRRLVFSDTEQEVIQFRAGADDWQDIPSLSVLSSDDRTKDSLGVSAKEQIKDIVAALVSGGMTAAQAKTAVKDKCVNAQRTGYWGNATTLEVDVATGTVTVDGVVQSESQLVGCVKFLREKLL